MKEKRQIIYLGITVFGFCLFPVILLILSNRLEFVNFNYAIPTIFIQLFSPNTLSNIPVYLSLLISTIIIAIVSTVLLFDIQKSTIEYAENWLEKILRYFTPKHPWHILLGYFITILALNPLIAYEFMRTQATIQPITLYQSYVVSAIIIATGIVIARILSKLDLKIIDTNIGIFIIFVYVSAIIYASLSTAYIPVEQLTNFVTYDPKSAEGVFMIYGSEIICTLIAFCIDWLVITKLLKKRL